MIGVFTLLGLLIAAAALVMLGAGKIFEKTHKIQLYFDKSVYGLQVGSDVRFGGVQIGQRGFHQRHHRYHWRTGKSSRSSSSLRKRISAASPAGEARGFSTFHPTRESGKPCSKASALA